MNALVERLQQLLRALSPREQLLLVMAVCGLSVLLVNTLIASPLRAGISRVETKLDDARLDIAQTRAAAREIRRLTAELAGVEAQIQPGDETNLFTLLEEMAEKAGVKDKLESIKPRQAAGNDDYREDRVDVQLKGASLGQIVKFLHQIQRASIHLIVRSIRIKPQAKGSALDVNLSVSSFTRT